LKKEEEEKLKNKRAPHLTNMNEDIQLSGKVYYHLSEIAQEPVVVGKQNCEPKPQIILRGAGI